MIKLAQKKNSCLVRDLGLVTYAEGYKIQQETLNAVILGKPNTIIFCEHPPVLTLGRLATEDNFLYSKDEIKSQGVDIVRIDRGGEVTFHGPGQLVIYPIFQLVDFGKDLKVYLHKLEQVAIDLLRSFDIVADRISGQRGVWVGKDKIASIGIGVRKWVSFHGIAVNVSTDLNHFSLIKPCGLSVSMTSLAKLKHQEIPMKAVKERATRAFKKVFNLNMI